MGNIFVNAIDDGYGGIYYMPTTAGYTLIVVLLILVLLAASAITSRLRGAKRPVNVRQLAFSAMAVALAMLASMIKLFSLPMGGNVTLLSMLFITLIGSWFGLSGGIACGVAYGLLQMFIDPYIISIPQLLCDYILAFGALGLSGLFAGKPNGYRKGYLAGIFGRFVFSVLSGVIFFAAYAPESGIFSNPLLYSAAYNGAYIAAEGVVTLVILSLPPVAHALETVRKMTSK
ncbi:MAG: energy-coupled thiamine transporter ThiT [Lachnospiraceae bacterium]|nr:energy-coupled thiamine transporter ThiT [Lachnospiraceae bacterium]